MIGCEGVRDLAQAYLDGDLDPRERERLERHLHACPACRQVVAEFGRLFAALAEPDLPPVPAGFAPRAAARAVAAERRRRAWQAVAVAAALCIVCGGAALLTWGGLPDGTLAAAGEALSLDVWTSSWEAAAGWVEGALSMGSQWLAVVPGGPLMLVALMVALGVELFLAYRWRAVARLPRVGE